MVKLFEKKICFQNDYIDILGDDPDAIKPHEQHYHIPRFVFWRVCQLLEMLSQIFFEPIPFPTY